MTNRRVFIAPRPQGRVDAIPERTHAVPNRSAAFHTPQETARVPAEAIDDARRGQRAARMLALPPAAVRT